MFGFFFFSFVLACLAAYLFLINIFACFFIFLSYSIFLLRNEVNSYWRADMEGPGNEWDRGALWETPKESILKLCLRKEKNFMK